MQCLIALFGVLLAVGALFVAKTRGLSDGGRALYLATFMSEFASIPARMFVGFLFAPFVLFIPAIPLAIFAGVAFAITKSMNYVYVAGFGLATLATFYFVAISIYPHIASLLYLFGLKTGEGLIMRLLLGARQLSGREMERYALSLVQLQGVAQVKLRAPTAVWVVKGVIPYAFVIGNVLYLTKPVLHNCPHTTAIIAQAMGYVNSADGRLIGALRRFTTLPFYLFSWAMGETAPGRMIVNLAALGGGAVAGIATIIFYAVLALAGGGFGSFMMMPAWSLYWKRAQVRHDAYAASLGQRQAMIDYLEEYSMYEVAVPYAFLTDQEDAELRIDALMQRKPTTTPLVPQVQGTHQSHQATKQGG